MIASQAHAFGNEVITPSACQGGVHKCQPIDLTMDEDVDPVQSSDVGACRPSIVAGNSCQLQTSGALHMPLNAEGPVICLTDAKSVSSCT